MSSCATAWVWIIARSLQDCAKKTGTRVRLETGATIRGQHQSQNMRGARASRHAAWGVLRMDGKSRVQTGLVAWMSDTPRRMGTDRSANTMLNSIRRHVNSRLGEKERNLTSQKERQTDRTPTLPRSASSATRDAR